MLFLFIQSKALAGFFTMDTQQGPKANNQEQSNGAEEIPLRDNTYNLIQKRQQEAYELIFQGRELIKKGQKKNDEELITKGKIKKEIGEKQVKALKAQMEQNKNEDQNNGWHQ